MLAHGAPWMTQGAMTLTDLDNQINDNLAKLKDVYRLAQDANVTQKLQQLLEKQPPCVYPLEAAVSRAIEARKRAYPGESDEETEKALQENEELLKSVASEMKNKEELVRELREFNYEVSENFIKVLTNQSEQTDLLQLLVKMMEGMSTQMAEVVQTPAQITSSQSDVWLDIAIEPAPGLHMGPRKSRLASVIRQTDDIWSVLSRPTSLELLRSHQNLPIRFVDAKDLPITIPDAHAVVWLSLGSDCLKDGGDDVERIRSALEVSTKRPRLLVLCMKYGAERAAKALRGSNGAPLLPVIWLQGDMIDSDTGSQHIAETVVPTLRKLLHSQAGLSLKELKDAAGQMKREESANQSKPLVQQVGAEGMLAPGGGYSRKPDDKAEPVIRDFNADRFQKAVCHVDELQAQDVSHVDDLRCELQESTRARLQLIRSGASDTHRRRRSVAMHVLECLTAGDKFSLIIRFGDMRGSLAAEQLAKEKIEKQSTLIWLDLDDPPDPAAQKLIKACLRDWDKECKNLAVILTTEQGLEVPASDYFPVFATRAICDKDNESSPVSELHGDIPISCTSKSEGGSVALLSRLSHSELAGMIRRAMDKIDKAFLAGIFEDNEDGALILRICVTDVGFLHTLRDQILKGEFGKLLVAAARDITSGEKRQLRRTNTEQLEATLSTPSRLPIPGDLAITVNLTNFAEMYEQSILRLDKLTPHQEEKLHAGLKLIDDGKSLHIKAPAGAGKTFVALHLIMQKLSRGPVLFVAVTAPLDEIEPCPHLPRTRLTIALRVAANTGPVLLSRQLGSGPTGGQHRRRPAGASPRAPPTIRGGSTDGAARQGETGHRAQVSRCVFDTVL